MQRQERIIANPLLGVKKVETRGKEVRVRRAFTDDDFGRLLAVAGERKVVYLAAWLTGLRRSELAGCGGVMCISERCGHSYAYGRRQRRIM